MASKGADGADAALRSWIKRRFALPRTSTYSRQRIELVVAHKKWNAAARALEGFKLALFHRYGAATDAHIWAGRIEGELGRWNRSLDEYRIALADRPRDVSLWLEYARAAETAGRDTTAREAYAQAVAAQPEQSGHRERATQALDARAARLRRAGADAPRVDGPVK